MSARNETQAMLISQTLPVILAFIIAAAVARSAAQADEKPQSPKRYLILGTGVIDIEVEAFKKLATPKCVLVYPCLYGWPSKYRPIANKRQSKDDPLLRDMVATIVRAYIKTYPNIDYLHIDTAYNAIRDAFEAYVATVKDHGDLGAVALMNEYCYRPIRDKRKALEQ